MQRYGNQERENNMLTLYSEYLQQKWTAEIERAIDKIKNPKTEWDREFRKEWHRSKWNRIHGWDMGRRRANQHWFGGGEK